MRIESNRGWHLSLLSVLLAGILTSLPAHADVAERSRIGHPEVADQLASFKQNAMTCGGTQTGWTR